MTAATKTIDWSKPVLRKQSTDCSEPQALRNATQREIAESRESEERGQDGYIHVDGYGTCYVEA